MRAVPENEVRHPGEFDLVFVANYAVDAVGEV